MSNFKRNPVLPDWEPIPWDAQGCEVDEQEKGFRQRALKPVLWTKVDWKNFPANGIFGHDRNWFISHDIEYVATFDGEDLILIRNTWHDFPDPPEWGLASRPAGNAAAPWSVWGHFPTLPSAWVMAEAI